MLILKGKIMSAERIGAGEGVATGDGLGNRTDGEVVGVGDGKGVWLAVGIGRVTV